MSADDLRLIGIAWRLDRLRWVPTEVLTDVVTSEGVCMWPRRTTGHPTLTAMASWPSGCAAGALSGTSAWSWSCGRPASTPLASGVG
jgi:hypothetical protein